MDHRNDFLRRSAPVYASDPILPCQPLRVGLWDRDPLSVSGEEFSVDVEDSESDSPSVPAPGDELASLRLSDRGPNSNRWRRESEAFFC
jgi:hypothetical protein